MSKSRAQLVSLMKECNEVFRFCARRLRILDSLSWGPAVSQEFFRKKETALPNPRYDIDRKAALELLAVLKTLDSKLKGDHPVVIWLERTRQSFALGAQLILEIEKPSFHEISCQIYGSPETKLFKSPTTNLDLARAITHRMAEANFCDIRGALVKSAEEFASDLERRLKARTPFMPVQVELSDDLASRAAARIGRVRIRRGSRFSAFDIISIFNHEIETHCLTAHNGSLQEHAEFLSSGGPRTTMTQEGLAIFFEMYAHSLSQHRFTALCDRVHAIKMAEQGADFLQLYQWYKERTTNEMEAFLLAQRIFRGSVLTGKYPLTKDVVYLAGLLGVYNFLRISVKNQNRSLVESLVCGRIALEDVPTIAWLRMRGLLSAPKFTPWWLDNWEALLSFFSFGSFLNTFDLTGFQAYFDEMSTLQSWDFSP